MANQRVQITFTNGDEFSGIIPDGLTFTSIDNIPATFQTSFCGQLWRRKSDIATIKTEDVTVTEMNLGFVLNDDPTWELFIEALYGENGKDVYRDYVLANKDSAFLTGNTIYP